MPSDCGSPRGPRDGRWTRYLSCMVIAVRALRGLVEMRARRLAGAATARAWLKPETQALEEIRKSLLLLA